MKIQELLDHAERLLSDSDDYRRDETMRLLLAQTSLAYTMLAIAKQNQERHQNSKTLRPSNPGFRGIR